MKKLLFIIYILFFIFSANAQREYWGMTTLGGKDFFDSAGITKFGYGVIFRTDKKGKNYRVAYNFDSATGVEPQGSLIQAANGKFYGFTTSVPSGYASKLFEFDFIKNKYKVLLDGDTFMNKRTYQFGYPFQASNGKIYSLITDILLETDPETGINSVIATNLNPAAGENYFMQASNGKVYFVSPNSTGIVGQRGALYELNLQTKAVTKRYQFIDGSGSAPYGSLIEWTPNILYGTFSIGSGPIVSRGGIFSFDLNTNTFTQKQLFYNVGVTSLGSVTQGGLTRHGNKLYGATITGGLNNKGLLYSYDPLLNIIDTLINFQTADYAYTYDSLRQDEIRNGYGWGCELVSAHDNKLYGLTLSSMFSFDPAVNKYENLNSITYGFTVNSAKLGVGPNYAHLLQTCFKPYYYFTIPDTVHVLQGNPLNFALGTPNTDTFRWYKANVLLPAQTDSTLNIATAALSDQGYYKCKMTNECGDSITKQFYLKVDIVTPLPLAFSGKVISPGIGGGQEAALLQWTDPAAKDIDIYTVQRSADSRNFTAINTQKAKTNQQQYNYTDEAFEIFANNNNGKVFYRLLQKTKDGKAFYSNIVLLTTAHSLLTITPNPAHDEITVTLSRGTKKIDLTIVDSKGSTVWKRRSKGETFIINTANWINGTYNIVVTNETGKSDSKQLVIQHR